MERAREYAEPFARVERLVRPERVEAQSRARDRERWWQFGERAPELYRAIAPLDRCIAITLRQQDGAADVRADRHRVAHRLVRLRVRRRCATSACCRAASTGGGRSTRASTMRTDVRYTPTDCFETFAQPDLTAAVGDLGGELHAHRSRADARPPGGPHEDLQPRPRPRRARRRHRAAARDPRRARLRGARRVRLGRPRPRPRLPRDEVRDAVHVRARRRARRCSTGCWSSTTSATPRRSGRGCTASRRPRQAQGRAGRRDDARRFDDV